MNNNFLIQLDEKVKLARSKGENEKEIRILIKKAKQEYMQKIKCHWLNSIPETLLHDGTFRVSARIIIGRYSGADYWLVLEKSILKFSSWLEPEGIIKEVMDELSVLIGRELIWECGFNEGCISLRVEFYY